METIVMCPYEACEVCRDICRLFSKCWPDGWPLDEMKSCKEDCGLFSELRGNLNLTKKEVKDAYYGAYGKPDPHFDGLEAVASASTSKVVGILKSDNRKS